MVFFKRISDERREIQFPGKRLSRAECPGPSAQAQLAMWDLFKSRGGEGGQHR